MQLTTSASCRPNTAYTIGGVSWAAKRRIQRKALHRCRSIKKTGTESQNIKTDTVKYCSTAICTMDICHDGRGRRQIGNECCACPKEPHNCHTGDTRELWSEEKIKWCCENKGVGCKASYNCLTREFWSEEKTKWCCENKNQGCPS